MAKINTNYQKLQAGYLFPEIGRRVAAFTKAHPDADVIRLGIGDVTLPLAQGLVERLKEGIDVADVGCGQGHAINLMAQAFPNSRFTGYDFSAEGVGAGFGGKAGVSATVRPKYSGHADFPLDAG